MPWAQGGEPGVERKVLVAAGARSTHEISIVRLAANAQLPAPRTGSGLEVMVLAGTWDLPEGPLQADGYTRRPATRPSTNSTSTGCTLFVRSGPFDDSDHELIHSQTDAEPWLPGQGGLTVKPLHSFQSESTALVHWPAGERFVPHQHWGGEEILVLSGTFMDEHGRYPTGTWLLSPHMSAHHPFVEEETVIFVKTGHVRAASSEAPA